MGSNYNHLSFDERKIIEASLNVNNVSLKNISSSLNRSDKCIRYEIKAHRYISIRSSRSNKCGRQDSCHIQHLCNSCENGKCSHCKFRHCNDLCTEFIETPVCDRIDRFPFVCTGCTSINSCKLPKYVYSAQKAHEQSLINNSNWKTGPKKSIEDMEKISRAVKEGVSLGHSPEVIIHQYDLPISVTALYSYIDQGLIPGVDNLSLKSKVRYKPRKTAIPKSTRDYEYLKGRRFEDFTERILQEDCSVNIWEMDSIIGKRDGNQKTVLSLLHRKSNLQFYFLMNELSTSEVERIFDGIKKYLGPFCFKRTFTIILTDNGSEFKDPISLEIDPDNGEQLISIYYCEPRRSDQKGKCEKNHELFRMLIPKGISMNGLSKKDINYVSNMVNNYPRRQYNYKTPYEIAENFLEKKVFDLNRLSSHKTETVNLTPIIH